MESRSKTWRILRLLLIFLGLIALGVGAWWLRPWESQDAAAHMAKAKAALEKGEDAWRSKDYPASLQHWQQASVHVGAAEKRLERKKKKDMKPEQAEAFRAALGEVHYYKARC